MCLNHALGCILVVFPTLPTLDEIAIVLFYGDVTR